MVGRGGINGEIARQREIEANRQAQWRAPILSELNAATLQDPTEDNQIVDPRRSRRVSGLVLGRLRAGGRRPASF